MNIAIDFENYTEQVCKEQGIPYDEEKNGKFLCMSYCYKESDEYKTGTLYTLQDVDKFFANPTEFLKLGKSNARHYIFTYNLRYDRHFCPRPDAVVTRGSAILKMSYAPHGNVKEIVVLDLFNYFKDGLAKITKAFGFVEKPDLSDISKRCESDAQITFQLWEKIYEMHVKYEVGTQKNIKLTAPAFAKTVWRNMFLGNAYINNIHADQYEELDEELSEAYKGGRVENFVFGTVKETADMKFRAYDVNSLYPSVMLRYYPMLPPTPAPVESVFDKEQFGICRARVRAPDEMNIPYLATRHEGKLCFPVGEFEGVWSFFELQKARALGYIITPIKSWSCGHRKGKPFKAFVEFFYDVRQREKQADRKNSPADQFAKLLMNSLYGKFGQKQEYYKDEPTVKAEKVFDTVGWKEEYEYPEKERVIGFAGKTNPIWAIYVTAYARDLLYTGITGFEKVGGIACYCDTDSVKGFLPVGVEPPFEVDKALLGAWKDETEGDFITALGSKIYTTAEEAKHKGVPSRAELLSSAEGVLRFYYEAPNSGNKFYGARAVPWEKQEKLVNLEKCQKRIVPVDFKKFKFEKDFVRTKPLKI